MPQYKKPIQQSVLWGCIGFVTLLSLTLSALSYVLFSTALYNRYNAQLEDIVSYIESHVDADDLLKCVETGTPSAKYAETQEFLNGIIDSVDFEYLYIVMPSDEEPPGLVNIVSATSTEEREAGETDLPLLYYASTYSKESVEQFMKAWETPGMSYFEETSDWGNYYTGCKPIYSSDGKTVALICADISTSELHAQIESYIPLYVGLAVLLGALFCGMQVLWIRRNVTQPIVELERSTNEFAARSHEMKNLRVLPFNKPEIQTENEVKSLANSVAKMADDMQRYANDIISAEERARAAERTAEGAERIAYQDALTHVKNKAAYTNYITELDEEIAAADSDTPVCFAVVMMDMDNLKGINDAYGHEHGDGYIKGGCSIISTALKHSPVFRIGGDEFVAILRGSDYEKRERLLGKMEDAFRKARTRTDRKPWERYSASVGMAVYARSVHKNYADVFNQADEIMYSRKRAGGGERHFVSD